MIKNLFIKYREIVVYFIFGVLTTLVNLLAFFSLQALFGEQGYLIHNAVAWVVGVIFAYIVNKMFVFKANSWEAKVVVKESAQFLVGRLLSFIVEELGMLLLVDVLRLGVLTLNLKPITLTGEGMSKLLLAVIVVILNYIFSKFIVFKK